MVPKAVRFAVARVSPGFASTTTVLVAPAGTPGIRWEVPSWEGADAVALVWVWVTAITAARPRLALKATPTGVASEVRIDRAMVRSWWAASAIPRAPSDWISPSAP